jgi:glucosamine--fructose-6-phosphate aminotransferase (isomerizing)
MCGIVGYIGPRKPLAILLDGLRRLEYRGYDSAGLAVIDREGRLEIRRASGKLHNLEESLRLAPADGWYGIGHTRWATHGRPTEENAHPHRDSKGNIVVVHNGIIENYLELKSALEARGHVFHTETDTEIIPHLIEEHFQGNLEEAVRRAAAELKGIFAIAVISRLDPGKIVAARQGPPVVVGIGQDEYFVASDIPAILSHTRDVFFLHDGDMAVLGSSGVRLTDFEGKPVQRPLSRILWDPVLAEKGGYRHFMLKEIFEQPRAVRDTITNRIGQESGRVFLDEMQISPEQFRAFRDARIVACGTSWHAALVGKFMIERLARLPVEVDYGSEFRYRDPLVGPETLTILISQSGETADTLAAQREAKRKGSPTLSICNVMGAMISREAAGVLMTHAGPEIGVASTKAFTAQLAALFLLAMYLGQVRRELDAAASQDLARQILSIPAKMERLLAQNEPYDELVKHLFKATDFLYLGRGIHYPIALEGALKLKEISYIHAEGYPAGEMKHGPNALIDETLPVVVIATADPDDPASVLRFEKTLSNIEEVKARGGRVLCIATEGMEAAARRSDDVLWVPPAPELLLPLLEVIPLQLLAYHIAVRRGCDVDQPRNLAKSVTVE